MKFPQTVLIAAIICALAAGSARAGAGAGSAASRDSSASAQLVIKRAANFGNHTSFNIYVDGRWADNLSYGETYRGRVAPGEHLITIQHMPHLNDAYPYSKQLIRVAPGRTSTFTAIWRDGGTRIALEESSDRAAWVNY